MGTIGELFVNIGANLKGLTSGLTEAQDKVDTFAKKAQGSESFNLKGTGLKFLDEASNKADAMKERWESINRVVASFGTVAKEAARQQELVAAATKDALDAEQLLAKAKGDRRNVGQAREMLVKKGYNPDKAATELAVVSLEPQRKELEKLKQSALATTEKIAQATEKLKSIEISGRKTGDFKNQSAELAKRVELTKKLEDELAKVAQAEQKIVDIKSKNRERESIKGDLKKSHGIDMSKGQMGLENKSLDPFVKNLGGAQKALDGVKAAAAESGQAFSAMGLNMGALVGLSGAAVAGIGMAAKAIDELVGQQAKLATQLSNSAAGAGMSVEAYQKLSTAYKDFGISDATWQVFRLSQTIEAATETVNADTAAIKKLGFSMQDIQKMSPDEQFNKIIASLRGVADASERARLGNTLFGRGYKEIAKAVNATEKAFKDANDVAEKLVVSGDTIHTLKETGLSIEDLGGAFAKVKMEAAGVFAPMVKMFYDGTFTAIADNFEELKTTFKALAVTAAVIYDLLAIIANALRIALNIVTGLWKILQAIGSLIAGSILKGVQLLVRAFEFLTGSSHEFSDGMQGIVDEYFSSAGELAESILEDVKDIGRSIKDMVVPDAIIATWSEAEKAAYNAEQAMKKSLESTASGATQTAAEIEKVAKAMEGIAKKNKELARDLKFGPTEEGKNKGAVASAVADLPASATDEQKKALEQAIRLNQTLSAQKKEQEKTLGVQVAYEKQLLKLADDLWKVSADKFNIDVQEAQMSGSMSASQAIAVADAKERLRAAEKQKSLDDSSASIVNGLQEAVNKLGKSEAQLTLEKLKQNKAYEAQYDKAVELQAILEEAGKKKNIAEYFDKLNEKLLEAQGNEDELLRAMLAKLGVAADAMDEAVARTKSLQDETKKATEAVKARENAAQEAVKQKETIASTLEDFADEIKKATETDAKYQHDKFVKMGMSDEQVAMADSAVAELEKIKQSTSSKGGGTEGLDSALGSIKVAGNFSGTKSEKNQEKVIAASQEQIKLLEELNKSVLGLRVPTVTPPTVGSPPIIDVESPKVKQPPNLDDMKRTALRGEASAPPSATSMPSSGVKSASGGTDDLIRQSNTLLEKIVVNTGKNPLQGVMT